MQAYTGTEQACRPRTLTLTMQACKMYMNTSTTPKQQKADGKFEQNDNSAITTFRNLPQYSVK